MKSNLFIKKNSAEYISKKSSHESTITAISFSLKTPIFLLLFSIYSMFALGQQSDTSGSRIPIVDIKTLDGKIISTGGFGGDTKPYILIVWKSCCSNNIKVMDEINDKYIDWQEKSGMRLITVSIDDSRSSQKLTPMVNAREWEFEVYLDVNSDFKRALNIINTPHVFIVSENNEILWQKVMYNPNEVSEISKFINTMSFE